MKKQVKTLAAVILAINTAGLFSPAYSLNSHLLQTVYAADEEPAPDEELPDAAEQSALIKFDQALKQLELDLSEGEEELIEMSLEEAVAAQQTAINASKTPGAKARLAELNKRYEALKAKAAGNTDPNPSEEQPTTETEEIPVTIVYRADETRDYGVRETEKEGTPGQRTYTIINGKRDEGRITKDMDPKVIVVGTKPSVTQKEIPAGEIYEDDSTLEEGQKVLKQAGKPGIETTTTTYQLDTATGEVTPKVTQNATPAEAAVYRRGTKKADTQPQPTVEVKTEEIPVATTYVADETLAYGERQTKPGIAGVRTITITNGQSDGGKITKEMVPTVITVGTKPTVVESAVVAPSDKVYEDDASLAEGTEVLKTPAVAGKKVVTTTYSLNPQTGEVTSSSSEQVQPGQAAVYRRGTKKVEPTVEVKTEEIPVATTYVADETLAYGERQTQPGTGGVRTITITDGQSDGGKITTAMVPTVITVGTKPTVVESVVAAPSDKVYEDDASLAEGTEVLKTPAVAGKKVVTTTYSLNPQTGEVTSSS
ncbi:G5 domain-containing protein, partial [Streptococcus caledonicus]